MLTLGAAEAGGGAGHLGGALVEQALFVLVSFHGGLLAALFFLQ
ncbi:hypothetical protein [Kitasatospora herbaricolor]